MSSRLKILHVTPYFFEAPEYGGLPLAVRVMARGLSRKGHDVDVWTTGLGQTSTQNLVDIPPSINLRLFKPRWRALGKLLNSPIILDLVFPTRRSIANYDIVHIHGYWFAHTPSIAASCRKSGVPLVVQPHGTLGSSTEKYWAKRLFHSFVRGRVVASARAFIALSAGERGELIRQGIPDSLIRIVPNPAVRPGFPLPSRESAREELRLPIETKAILYLGRLHREKGVEQLLLAFQIIRERVDHSILIFAGPDEGMEAKLISLTRRLGMSGVKFLGKVDAKQKWTVLRAANVLCLPSFSEGFPVVLLEAAVAETPIILSRKVNIPELVKAKAVFVADPTPKSLAEAIVTLLGTPTTGALLVKSALASLSRDYTEESTCRRLQDVYNGIREQAR